MRAEGGARWRPLSGCSATPATASSKFHRFELPTPPDRSSLVAWVATLWPDATSNNGWSALAWSKADRGLGAPRHLAVGDVRRGSASPPSARRTLTVEDFELRWYGWVAYSTDLALIVEGPYPHAPAAADGAATPLRLAAPNVGIDPGWVPDELGDDRQSER